MIEWLRVEKHRKYVYRVFLALQPVLVAYGLITDQMGVLWGNVLLAVLGLGLADGNTSGD